MAVSVIPVIETERLILRGPIPADVDAWAACIADPDVTRYLGWRRHASLADTRGFVEFSNTQWKTWNSGPMLAISRESGALLGGTGLSFDGPDVAQTGYGFAKDAWGQGFATEALRAMIELASQRGVTRLYAVCHAQHQASWRVLEKCGFRVVATERGFAEARGGEIDELVLRLE